jgi:N-acetyl-anhydromuramyl-L-alanine amidase AmpD
VVAQGLVLLSDADTDAPSLPALASVSKDDAWDDGAFGIAIVAAQLGALVVDRPYFTGHPDPEWLAAKVDRNAGSGILTQVGNEQNLALEGFTGGPAEWFAFEDEVTAASRFPDSVIAMPPSPGAPGWDAWVRPDRDRQAVHCYGTFDQMRGTLEWFLEHTRATLYVTECNPGAGQSFNLNTWALADLTALLNWSATQPRIAAVCYFAWRWDQSPSLPSSIDAAGTAVTDVLTTWRPPINGGAGPEWYPGAVQRPISVNYTPGRAGQRVRAVVEHIADGYGSCFGWFNQDRGSAGSSAHFWIGHSGVVEQYRPLSDTCWANGPICDPDMDNPAVAAIVASGQDPNAQTVAIEHEGLSGEALTPQQTIEACDLTAWLTGVYGLPLSRSAVIGHDQIDHCDRAFCPGPAYPWSQVLGEEPPVDDLAQRQARTWDALDAVQALGAEWEAAGYPSTAVGLSSAAESGKSHVRATKGEL